MPPQPDNDNTPKAPDKNDKTKGDKHGNSDATKEKNKDFKTVNNLNDCELKDLLDEAITYKNPKDREGKSTLFKELLSQAEESERNARAASAGGSEQVRYCNTSAKRSKHRRKPNSISENVMHGGSLDNLAKEDLFEVVHHLSKPKRTVSARQREGGSLPSNVNAGSLASYDPQFLEEARRKRSVRGGGPPETAHVDMEETANLLDHDSVAENYERGAPTAEAADNASSHAGAPKFTTKATLQVSECRSNVDDPLHIKELDNIEKPQIEQISAKVLQTKYSVFIQDYGSIEAPKKVDENGNALQQNAVSKAKKKKIQAEKNVMSSYSAEKLVGHRGDIIHDVDKLCEFIGDDGAQNKTNSHRQKQVHKNAQDVGGKGGKNKRGNQASKNKETPRNELKKSNSLEEVSTTKLDGFKFEADNKDDGKKQRAKEEGDNNKPTPKAKAEAVPTRPKQTETVPSKPKQTETVQTKSKQADTATTEKSKADTSTVVKPKERKCSDNVEACASATIQETLTSELSPSDFQMVNNKKKKAKKRRNSLSGTRHKPSPGSVASSANKTEENSSTATSSTQRRRTSSPPVVPRRKSVCSVPHSEKSNDSSDVDSVHSLPTGRGQRARSGESAVTTIEDTPVSYADIARNVEKQQQKKQFADAKVGRDSVSNETSPKAVSVQSPIATEQQWQAVVTVNAQTQTTPPKAPPPDVHSIRNFPAISRATPAVNRVDRGMNTPKGMGRPIAQQQQQPLPDRQRGVVVQTNSTVVSSNAGGRSNQMKHQTVVASSQTQTNYVPEPQPQQQQQQHHQQRDIKTDLSIIQANEMETVQYNNQMMPNMEIPDVQTIEKLNYMNQPGSHMPPHLQHHVVPPQHLHIAMSQQQQQQQRPQHINQPPPHIPMMMQHAHPPQQQAHPHHPEIYHPQPYNPQPPTQVVAHHHHHHHHPPGGVLAYPPQAYEGMAVAYVDPAYLPAQPLQIQQPQQLQAPPQVNHHQVHVQQQIQPASAVAQQPLDTPRDRSGKWVEPDTSRSKPKEQKRFERSQDGRRNVHAERRRDNAGRILSNAPPQHHYNQPTPTPVTLYRREPQQIHRRGAKAEPTPPPTGHAVPPAANCDSAVVNSNEAGTNVVTVGDAEDSSRVGGANVDRPPVVILSGAAKDVPGIEFGFAVNPDLVRPETGRNAVMDPIEIFERYYVPPPESLADSYNHDKVIHFIGSAWDDVVNSDKAHYYSSGN